MHMRPMSMMSRSPPLVFDRLNKGERALLIQPVSTRVADRAGYDDALDEFSELAHSAGASVVGTLRARVATPNSASYIGSGKLEEAQAMRAALDADLVLVNPSSTPGNGRAQCWERGCQEE